MKWVIVHFLEKKKELLYLHNDSSILIVNLVAKAFSLYYSEARYGEDGRDRRPITNIV